MEYEWRINVYNRRNKGFIGYEYKGIITDLNSVSFFIDGYENFGWEQDENLSVDSQMSYLPNTNKVTLWLKRNRKIINKAELTRLQRNFEACVREIEELEKSKTSTATVYALVIGISGTACMAGSVFAIIAQPPNIVVSILFAIPAIFGWIFPYFIYRKVMRKRTEKITPLIEKKYDEIYEICEKGNKLLH